MATFFELMPAFSQIEDGNGNPLSGGKLNFYIAGTSTRKDTFRESDGVTANANPIILDSSGYPPFGIWGTTGAYKIVLTDAADVVIRTRDNVLGVGDSTTASGMHRVIGLTGVNNTGTPNTQYDIAAQVVQLWQPSTKQILIVVPGGTLTNNVSTSGPVANGRDQSSAFSSASWIHLYYIYNGTTLATISSTALPSAGPTLPSGYTHWAYVGAVRFNGSSQIVPTYIRDDTAYYQTEQNISTFTATTETTVTTTSVVPPNAKDAYAVASSYTVTSDAGGILIATLTLRLVTGVRYGYFVNVNLAGLAGASLSRTASGIALWIPNIGNAFLAIWVITNGSTQTANLDVLAYRW